MSNDLQKSILNLESLELKFKNKLIEYQNAYNSYINQLNTDTSASAKLKILPNTVYYSPPSISTSVVGSADACLALCGANSSCKSALYNTKLGDCSLQSGTTSYLANDPSGIITSIVPDTTINLQQLKMMNDELILLNNSINDEVKKQYSSVNQYYSENATTNQNMIATFQKLQGERDNIDKMMDELESIKENNNDQRLRISQGGSKYVVWGIIALVTMFITVKMIFFPDSDTNVVKLFFNACILILLILWTMNLSSVVVTFIVLFLIAMILISKFT